MKITYDELINVETRGRWWIVGAGWVGNANKSTTPTSSQPSSSSSLFTDPKLGITVDLLALATKQKMNTDLRRAVFCILMSSEDYMDAVSKLLMVGMKNKTKEFVYPTLDN